MTVSWWEGSEGSGAGADGTTVGGEALGSGGIGRGGAPIIIWVFLIPDDEVSAPSGGWWGTGPPVGTMVCELLEVGTVVLAAGIREGAGIVASADMFASSGGSTGILGEEDAGGGMGAGPDAIWVRRSGRGASGAFASGALAI
ncbi:MAG: hypothetical protein H6712_09720 [Myxococcales bacterium]|nr:hypothetical protein [Myxococcales bacterium]